MWSEALVSIIQESEWSPDVETSMPESADPSESSFFWTTFAEPKLSFELCYFQDNIFFYD